MSEAQLKPVSFAARREKFLNSIEGGVAIIPAQPEIIRNHDVHYKFRQDSTFYYLTGFDEPDAVAVFKNTGGKKEFHLFVRPRNETEEIWTGRRAGVEGALRNYGVDKAYSVEDFQSKMGELFRGAETVYYTLLKSEMDPTILKLIDEYRRGMGRSGRGLLPLRDVAEIVGEMRIRKSTEEIDRLREAGRISAFAHTEAMARCRPGLYEYQLEALIEYVFRNSGCDRIGYNSIVASGENATVLHYNTNDRKLEDGELILIDAGGEYNYYTADITRTFPVNGK